MASQLSLIVPFWNEESAISHFVQSILSVLDGIAETDWEIVCVDDGSSDGTLRELIGLAEADRRFRVLELSRNFGKEAALTAGLDAATGDAVIIIDADLQDQPDIIPRMVQLWRDGAEVVLDKRIERSSDSMLKRRTASWFYALHNQLSHI